MNVIHRLNKFRKIVYIHVFTLQYFLTRFLRLQKKKKIFYLSTELLNYAFIKFSNEWFEGGKGNGFEENRFINLHPNLQREVSVMADNA